jgi:guanine deaminase
MMDRNAPEALRDTAQSGYDASATLIQRWHKTADSFIA